MARLVDVYCFILDEYVELDERLDMVDVCEEDTDSDFESKKKDPKTVETKAKPTDYQKPTSQSLDGSKKASADTKKSTSGAIHVVPALATAAAVLLHLGGL